MTTVKLILGIDVSKATLDVASDDQKHTAQFSNDPAGIDALLAFARQHHATLLLAEATGGLELPAL